MSRRAADSDLSTESSVAQSHDPELKAWPETKSQSLNRLCRPVCPQTVTDLEQTVLLTPTYHSVLVDSPLQNAGQEARQQLPDTA